MLKTTLQVKEGYGTLTMEGNELPAIRAVADFANGLTFGKTPQFQYSNTANVEVGSLVTEEHLKDGVRFFHSMYPNQLINCIKLIRHMTCWGLKEAKDFVVNVTVYPNNPAKLVWQNDDSQS